MVAGYIGTVCGRFQECGAVELESEVANKLLEKGTAAFSLVASDESTKEWEIGHFDEE